MKGEGSPTVPKDPLIYRFQEVTYVYGRALKEVIEEKFGAGIMSAIDFTLDVERVSEPKRTAPQSMFSASRLAAPPDAQGALPSFHAAPGLP